MTSNALSLIDLIFSSGWALFNSWHIPGTLFTPAAFFFFFILVKISKHNILAPLVTRSSVRDFGLAIRAHGSEADD